MAYKDIQSVVANIQAKQNKVEPIKFTSVTSPTSGYQVGKFDVPIDAIYDRLSDGNYVAKYENYLGAEGNEDRLAKDQSWYERVGYGLSKNLTKVGTYALDATVGTVVGVWNGISEGKLSSVWDNDFSNKMDDWNKQLDYKLPNHYTDEEKSFNLLESLFKNPANFLANDVAGGLAFVGGAILPEIAIGVLTGGASISTSAAKLGFTSASKAGKIGGLLNKVDDAVKFSQGRALIRQQYRTKLGEVGGNIASTSGFLLRTSNFEAGMEARHNFKDAISTYMETFEEKNGRQPTYDELSKFTDDARKASNGVYGANMAILTVSNAAMFGKTFNLKTPTISNSLKNKANRIIGLGTKTEVVEEAGQKILKTSLIESNVAQRVLGKTYKILGKPAIEGIYEEGFQGVAGKSMQNYLEAKYDPTSDAGYAMFASITDAFADQYGTKEGWKEMGIGMIIGFAGGAVQPGQIKAGRAFSGFGKNSYSTAREQVEQDVDKSNAGITALRSMNRASSIRNFRNISDSKADNYQSTSAENAMMNYEFIKSQEHMKSASEIDKDFSVVVDNMQLDQNEMDELESRGLDIEEYKSALKDEFKSDIKAYNFAKSTVEALGLDQHLKETPGSLSDIKDAITMNLMLGKNSEQAAKNVAKQIGQVIGVDGMFDYMEHYNKLSYNKKLRVNELINKKQQLKDAEKAAKDLGLKIATLPKGTSKDGLKSAYEKEATKLTVAQSRIQQIREEKDALTEAINEDFVSTGFQLNSDSLIDNPNVTVDEVIENLNKLETYTKSLRSAGKDVEADSIDYLTGQFKFYSEANREMTNLARQMRDTNFFSTKEGRGLISSIVGDKYEIDPEFKKAIEDNDEYIKKSIAAFSNKSETEIDSYEEVKRSIQDNPNLSEREKFRLSSILRVQLGLQSVYDKAAELQQIINTPTTEKQTAISPLDGDTVSIKQSQELKERNIDSVELLGQTIDDITTELDFLVTKAARNEDTIEALRKEREELRTQLQTEGAKTKDISDLRNLANRIKNGEDATSEIDLQLQTNFPQTLESILKNEDRIQFIDEKLKSLDTSFRIIDSPEYLRLNELYKKKENAGLSQAETEELTELEEDIDQWLLVTGTIAGGLRLSDLIKQKVALEEAEVLPLENVESVSSKDVMDGVIFSDKSQSNHYDITQTYDAVTAALDSKTNLIEVAGISAIDLAQEIGEPFDFKVSTKGTNTILISQDEIQRINSLGKVKILPTNKNLDTNYSVVTTLAVGIDGVEKRIPLRGGFQNEFTQFQNIEAVFGANIGDVLSVEIDANDAWNKALLDDYQTSVGLSNITEEQEEDLVEARHKELVASDKVIQSKIAEIQKIEEELKSPALKQKDIDKKKKKLTTLSNQILTREDVLRDRAQKAVDKLKGITPSEKEITDQTDYIARTIVIKVKDKDGNFLSVFKGIRTEGDKGITGEQFEALRYQIATETDLIPRLAATRGVEKVKVKGLVVKKVFMGHPNYNFVDNADGSLSIEHRRVDAQQAKKVTDVGYVQEGKLSTKTQIKGVDTTFLSKFMKAKTTTKVPFIILEIGGKRVAYPVQTVTQQKEPLDEFSKIFNSTADDTTKVIALNKFMAARGLDVTKLGNTFLVAGENNNLTDKFFNEKLAQLENIEYFYSLDNWISPTANIQEIVENQVLVDIDLITPFHSPKLQMDLSAVEISPKFKKNVKQSEDDQVEVEDIDTEKEAEDNINEPC